ncbi:TolC family protein [Thiomicrorhabdus sediminis]|uniref:OmpA-like domain-containing protein n=1 Tax=Thiomicrorhabdus sediminis TaxID=2580412 RepID=A0A4P9K6N9_9GAMM|nr:TolC family protein [Thiomicrorhabdus sediminis]QCU90732.1 hypothetical protein FE785_08875 [Thiomicrorhabdus sediminis]
MIYPTVIKTTRTILFSSLFLPLGFINAHAESTTLQQAITEAIETNPEVQAAWHNFLSSQANTEQASAEYGPSVDLFADYSVQFRSNYTNKHFDGASGRISLTQMLYDGNRTEYNTEAFKNNELVRYFELLSAVEKTGLDAYIAYQDVLRYRELAILAQKNYNSHKDVQEKILAGVETGFTRGADLEQINGRLALAESNLLTEKANLHDVSARYLRIIGKVPTVEMSNADLESSLLPGSFADVMGVAYEHNANFHAALRNTQAKRSTVQVERAANKPRLDLTAQYGARTYNDNGFDEDVQDGKIALEFRYNLYDHGRTSSAITGAKENVSRAQYLREKACVDMRQTLQIAYNDVQKISDQLPILTQHRDASDMVRTAFADQFAINRRTLLDLLDTEIEYFQAGRAYTNSFYDRNISVAKTLAEMGTLLSKLEITRNGLPNLADLGAEKMEIVPEMMCPLVDVPNMDIAALIPKEPSKFAAPEADNTEGNTYRLEIQFQYNSSAIDPKYSNDIAELARFMEDHPDTVVEIRGHASLEGSEVYNQWLSERRAQAVVDELINTHNIDPNRLSSVGFGETQPLIDAMTAEAHKANRRIESNIKNKE